MSDIIYLANPQSPHVRQWLELRDLTKPIIVYHIGAPQIPAAQGSGYVTVPAIPSKLQCLPSIFQYFILGLIVRYRLRSSTAIHAHNSSGYGLAALLSNKKYIITTYGTEVFGAASRGLLYRKLLSKVFQNSTVITSTSTEMTKTILLINPNLQSKIETFSLGVPEPFLSRPTTSEGEKRGDRCWFVNRRIHPHYETDVVVDAFIEYLRNGGTGSLQLLKGDCDPVYYKEICYKIEDVPEISVIDRFLDRPELIEYLDRSDFCISIPRSDQLSSSILEGMARGCVQVLAPLRTYKHAKLEGIYLDENVPLYDALLHMFFSTSKMSEPEFLDFQTKGKKLLLEKFSSDVARDTYMRILAKLSIENKAHR